MASPDPAPIRKHGVAGAIAMVVIGLLIFIPSGLCTGVIGVGALVETILHPARGEGFAAFVMVLTTGAPFVAAGFALIWFGVKRLRSRG
jgi:hypothetical protein